MTIFLLYLAMFMSIFALEDHIKARKAAKTVANKD